MYIRNYNNENTVIYKSHKKKGHKAIEEQNNLPRFLGGIVRDHDITMYLYGSQHYECIALLGRYLEEIAENVSGIKWSKSLKDLLFEIYGKRKELIKQEINSFTNEQMIEYEKRYEKIINLSKEENGKIKSTFYKGKAKTKVSGGFRSEDGCQYYCNTISIIKTAKKRRINPFEVIMSVFNGRNIFVC